MYTEVNRYAFHTKLATSNYLRFYPLDKINIEKVRQTSHSGLATAVGGKLEFNLIYISVRNGISLQMKNDSERSMAEHVLN